MAGEVAVVEVKVTKIIYPLLKKFNIRYDESPRMMGKAYLDIESAPRWLELLVHSFKLLGDSLRQGVEDKYSDKDQKQLVDSIHARLRIFDAILTSIPTRLRAMAGIYKCVRDGECSKQSLAFESSSSRY
jgi:hypothetical protein